MNFVRPSPSARYPPEGCRGIGGERATGWGECLAEHTAEANDHVLVVPIIETVRTAESVPRMCQVDGVDIFFFGPADFSATAGFRGQWEGPGVAEKILELKDTIRQAGKHCGVVATGTANLAERFEQGFRMLALGLDGRLLLRSLHESLAAVDRDRKIRSGFRVEDNAGLTPAVPASDGEVAMSETPRRFRVALTGDFFAPDGSTKYPDIGLSVFEGQAQIEWARFREHRAVIGADQVEGANGVIVLTPSVTAQTRRQERRPAGDRPVRRRVRRRRRARRVPRPTWSSSSPPAPSTGRWRRRRVGWMIALTHHFRMKDILVRTGRWDDRSKYMGRELRDRTFGAVGLGGIGRAAVGLAQRVRHEDAAGL